MQVLGRGMTDLADNLLTARVRDGFRLTYRLHGGSDAPGKLVLLHSLAMDLSFWGPVARSLPGSVQVLVYDARGHGRSDKPPGPYTVEGFADDLADLLDHVGWRSAVVAGASMGGCVSLAFATRYRDRLDGLGLVDSTAGYGAEAAPAWKQRADKALQSGLVDLVDFQKTRWFSDRFRHDNPDVVDQALEVFLVNDVGAYAEACRMLGACDLWADLSGLDMPVTILVGEEDYATPVATAEAMHQAIAHSTLRVISGARHFTPLEVPDIVAAELGDLLATARRSVP